MQILNKSNFLYEKFHLKLMRNLDSNSFRNYVFRSYQNLEIIFNYFSNLWYFEKETDVFQTYFTKLLEISTIDQIKALLLKKLFSFEFHLNPHYEEKIFRIINQKLDQEFDFVNNWDIWSYLFIFFKLFPEEFPNFYSEPFILSH